MPDPYYAAEDVTLHLGDSLDILPTLADASVDAIVCDPPYALTELPTPLVTEALTAWLTGDRAYIPATGRGGFMGRDWDRFVPPPAIWDQCWRVLKPGGHLLAFAAPRTADLMGMSIRLAGFEIRDSLHWIYGSGMPKGQNIGKAIDKAAGVDREIAGQRDRYLDGRTRRNQGDRNEIFGSGLTANGVANITVPATEDAARWNGWNTQLKPAHEPIILARKSTGPNTTVANVLEHGTGALNIDGCRIDGPKRSPGFTNALNAVHVSGSLENPRRHQNTDTTVGRWPTNLLLGHGPDCVDDGPCQQGCPIADIDRQSGITGSNASTNKGRGMGYHGADGTRGAWTTGDSGGASRFFPVFRYEAKAPASERPRLADGTAHTTVKPLALMRWLVRLVTPPGGLALDPFAGSGTTLAAALREGMQAVGVEQYEPYAQLCVARLSEPYEQALFSA